MSSALELPYYRFLHLNTNICDIATHSRYHHQHHRPSFSCLYKHSLSDSCCALPLQSIRLCVEGGERNCVSDWRRTTTTLWILEVHHEPQYSVYHLSAPYGSAATPRDKREYFLLPIFSSSLSIIFPLFFFLCGLWYWVKLPPTLFISWTLIV